MLENLLIERDTPKRNVRTNSIFREDTYDISKKSLKKAGTKKENFFFQHTLNKYFAKSVLISTDFN